MAKENYLTSIHGRLLGLNASGHLVSARDKVDPTLYPSADVGNINASIITGATAKNYGMTLITGTATAASIEIEAPAPGVKVELHFQTSASEITIGGTATDVIFKPAGAGVGSSIFISNVANAGRVVGLRGVTANQYNVVGSTVGLVIG
mgnify:CR=1 FL=1